MQSWRVVVAWGSVALVGFVVSLLVFRSVIVFYPEDWSITRKQAIEIAMEHIPLLGEPVENPYLVAGLTGFAVGEKALHEALPTSDANTLRAGPLDDLILRWRVLVYAPGKRQGEWTYRLEISLSGKVLSIQRRVPAEEPGEPIETQAAQIRAGELLSRVGFDLSSYEEPSVLRTEHESRTDTEVRFSDRRALLGEDVPYGLSVEYAGDRLKGFEIWIENPREDELVESLAPLTLLHFAWFRLMPFFIFPLAVFFFLRRYHAGEVGVRRAIRVFLIVLGSGTVSLILSGAVLSEEINFFVSRQAQTWAIVILSAILTGGPMALAAALSWSVGEARCRERWAQKLAAFDGFFKGRWGNATVASSALRGLAGASLLAALLLVVQGAMGPLGVRTGITLFLSRVCVESWPGVALIFWAVTISLYAELFTWLFLLPSAVGRLGLVGGASLVVVVAGIIFPLPFSTDPAGWFLLLGVLKSAVLVTLFIRYDLLTTLIASAGSMMVLWALPFLLSHHPFLILQGVLPLLVVALPLLVSFRHLRTGKALAYNYDDVPLHVRRIAERERQRLELETARGIQASILPDLPPQLGGFEIAHCYLPATEVGGDFYDALALEDGRLAVAVGDVAGHGVSSGLIMSAAKSTLALQMTVNPEVAAVFRTMNRMVCQAARKRLLTTLLFALVDRDQLELVYGSAGHIGPYLINAAGEVESLPVAAYPLGVREQLVIKVQKWPLAAGDSLFFCSDGIVEARSQGSGDLFGFDRLQASLQRNCQAGPAALRDGVLADMREFTGPGQREDDQTIVVLKVP